MFNLITNVLANYPKTATVGAFIGGFLYTIALFAKHGEKTQDEVLEAFSKGMIIGIGYPVTIPYFALRNYRKPYHVPTQIE